MQFTRKEILTTPLPHLPLLRYRILVRGLMLMFRSRIHSCHGVAFLRNLPSPHIIVANHTCYAEAVLFPLLLIFLRSGAWVHFMADWSFLLNPFVRPIFKLGKIIPVLGKPAKPKFLNRYKHKIVSGKYGSALASDYLAAGHSVGVFPEGVAHGNLATLRPFKTGAAQLAIKHNIPILPTGIRFPKAKNGKIGLLPKMCFHFGEPVFPDSQSNTENINQQLLNQVALLSQKQTMASTAPTFIT